MWGAVRRKTTAIFGFDPHSVALFRGALGLMVLRALVEQAPHLYELYDDRGLAPRGVILYGSETRQYEISIYNISGWWGVCAALFLLHGAAAVCLIAGHRVRLAAAVNWFMLASMFHRHPMPEIGGDTYVRVCSFWAMFLPLDAAWALDAPAAAPRRTVSPGSVAILGQICLMYVASVYQKSGDAWTQTGTAIFHACNIADIDTPISRYIVWLVSTSPLAALLSTWATRAVLSVEYYVPWLLLSPLFPRVSKALGTTTLLAMHLVFAISLGIWQMSFQFALPLLCVLPTTLAEPRGSNARRPWTPAAAAAWILCAICFASVTFTTLEATGAFAPAPSEYCHGVTQFFSLHQEWCMFSPEPATRSVRYVFEGTRPNASSVRLRLTDPGALRPFDPERDLAPGRAPPEDALSTPLMRIMYAICLDDTTNEPKHEFQRRLFLSAIGRYMCREGRRRLSGVKIWEIMETSVFMLPTRIHYHTKVVWDHRCYAA